jgi:Xaa-Pro aminopeptidase
MRPAFSATPSASLPVPELKHPPENLGPLFNRARATDIMRRAGLSGLAVTSPLNVYYTTNALPVLSRFSQINSTVALIPANPSLPIAFICDAFEYYAGASDSGLAEDVVPYLVSGAQSAGAPAPSAAFDLAGSYAFDAREQRRRAQLNKAAPYHESVQKAVAKALQDQGMHAGVIGTDSAEGRELMRRVAPHASVRDGSDLILHIRMVKTPTELQLMRRASENNVQAAIATAHAVRDEGSVFAVRQRFFQEAAKRGNLGVYASVDLVMSELADGGFREGQGIMVDFVSHYAFYQGDFGRTIYFGEPDARIRRAADVGSVAWREIRERLKPGLRFSEIHEIGKDTVQKLGETFHYAFHPHGVGLQHWDHPRTTVEGTIADIALEPGMVLSVDCPLLAAGVNGTTHIEDLVVITETGAELIHSPSEATFQV